MMAGRTRDPETLVFLHLPKTGGRTLRAMLRRQYGPERVFDAYGPSPAEAIERYERLSAQDKRRYRVVVGHVPITLHRKIPGGCRYLTMLRHPVDRVVSDYFFIRRNRSHPKHELLGEGGMNLDDALRSGAFPMFENGQSRILANCWNAYGECPPDVVDRAMKVLDRHRALVGLTERYDETLLLMGRELDWSWSRTLYVKRNVNSKRPQVEDLPDRTIDLIRRLNEQDLELYRRIEARLDAEFAAAGMSFRSKLTAFRLANRGYNRFRRLHSVVGRLMPGPEAGKVA